VNLFASECSEYQNAHSLRKHEEEHPGFYERCASRLGPSQPGVTTPDESYTGKQEAKAEEAEHHGLPAGKAAGKNDGPKLDELVKQRKDDGSSEAQKRIEDAIGMDLPDLLPKGGPPAPAAPQGGGRTPPTPQQAQQLLDFLFAP
jgi:hypothetical protein